MLVNKIAAKNPVNEMQMAAEIGGRPACDDCQRYTGIQKAQPRYPDDKRNTNDLETLNLQKNIEIYKLITDLLPPPGRRDGNFDNNKNSCAVDIDFDNPAGFLGTKATPTEGQFMVYYLSHAMMFCAGVLIEAHVVLTPASCVIGERYKFEVFAGSHKFIEFDGSRRWVNHLCIHRGYNHSKRWSDCPPECSPDNLALLVLNDQYSFHKREPDTEFIINRVRYGASEAKIRDRYNDETCSFFGWGSRRNGYLVPLLIHARRLDVHILPREKCFPFLNYQNKYLCVQQPQCKSQKFGALCPDDMGSVIVCSGFAQGIMTSRVVDRPCGVGFLDLSLYNKFLTCGVDDARDVIQDSDNDTIFEFPTRSTEHKSISLITPHKDDFTSPQDF